MIYAHTHEHGIGGPSTAIQPHIHDTNVMGYPGHTHEDPYEHGGIELLGVQEYSADSFGNIAPDTFVWNPAIVKSAADVLRETNVPDGFWDFVKQALSGKYVTYFSLKDTLKLWAGGTVLFVGGWIVTWLGSPDWGSWMRHISLGMFISCIWFNWLWNRRA